MRTTNCATLRAVPSSDPDVIVIGSGPNGLVAACVLARAGLRVEVVEAHAKRPGGAVGSDQGTRPGFIHDVGAAFFPWGRLSPAFADLDLTKQGLLWARARFDSCHPSVDGSYACIASDDRLTAEHFGNAEDGMQWRRVARWYRGHESSLLNALLGPLPGARALAALGPAAALRLAGIFTASGRRLGQRWFTSDAARRVLPALGLHVDAGPDDIMGAGIGFMLGMTAITGGFSVPRGGAGAITASLVAALGVAGGRVHLGRRVHRVITEGRRAVAVDLGNEQWRARKAVVADTGAPALLLRLVDRELVSPRVVEAMERFPRGFGTFKVDWALSRSVPWQVPAAHEAAVVHTGDSVDDLARFTRQVRAGEIPDRPYLVIGQQSLIDPTRAPMGQHTLWAYSRVPSRVPGGWPSHAQSFADTMEARIESLAPGFRDTILARRIVSPKDLQAMNANLVGGDLGGGSNAWHRQLFFRPVLPYFRYRTPVDRLYLCSSYTHPGAGVHGMCGYNAAHQVLADLGQRPR